LTENRFTDNASSAMFQVHEGCFSSSLSEFKHTKMRNGAMAHLKTACGPPVGNHWSKSYSGLHKIPAGEKYDRKRQ